MPPIYQKPGLTLAKGAANDPALVKALQRDLRALGYIAGGIDGKFESGTERAVRCLQHDLINGAEDTPGKAPVSVKDYNRTTTGAPAVTRTTGVVDQAMVGCIAAMLDDTRFEKVPQSANPARENQAAIEAIRAAPQGDVPTPFILAICRQESNLQHYRTSGDDNFVTVGLDRNGANPDVITSRGFGMGQFTIFYHPPSRADVDGFILNPLGNVAMAYRELKEKFDKFVIGGTSGTRADDRIAEHGPAPLRVCTYAKGDPKYLTDCKACATAAGKRSITATTTFHANTQSCYTEDLGYKFSDTAAGVPDRANFPCDWPYAARRYNGSGNLSYHYQARVLMNLLK
ncbi:MAG: peptidoglycan-binding domain-containing protein [Rhodospirillaceae bacterium]|nr:peptidoglycan-binding domain-containing protein [Rhodospirillaceae bacterium]